MNKLQTSPVGMLNLAALYATTDNSGAAIFGEEVYVAIVFVNKAGDRCSVYSAEDADPELFKQAIDLKTQRATFRHNTDGRIESIKP
jgi:hypothetical protein